MKKLFRSLKARARAGFLLLAQNIEKALFYLLILLLPTQFGRHFWPQFSSIYGIRIDYLSPTLYTTDIPIIFLFVISLVKLLKWLRNKFNTYSFLFIVIVIVGIITSLSPMAGWYGLVKLLEFVFLGVYVSKSISGLNFRNILLLFSLGIIFESFLSVVQFTNRGSLNGVFYFFGERFFNSQTPGIANVTLNGELVLRPYGTFPHPNVLAGYLLVGMALILLNLKLAIRAYEKIFFTVSIFLGSIAIFLSMSRVVVLLWLMVFCFGMIRHAKKLLFSNKTINYFLIVFILTIFSFLLFLTRFRFIDFRLSDESVVVRESLARTAFLMIEKKPILGVGLNNFLTTLPYFQKQTNSLFYLQPVHNIYLLIISQIGIIGFGFFLWFIYKTYKNLFNLKNKIKQSLFAVLSSILFIGFFDHYFLTLQQGQLMLSLVLGFCWFNNKTKEI